MMDFQALCQNLQYYKTHSTLLGEHKAKTKLGGGSFGELYLVLLTVYILIPNNFEFWTKVLTAYHKLKDIVFREMLSYFQHEKHLFSILKD